MVNFTKKLTIRAQGILDFPIVTVDPENMKALLATQFKDFDLGDRHPQLKPLLGDGIFTLSGNGWKHSRAILRPQFTRAQVSRVGSIEGHVQNLIRAIGDKSRYGVFDLQSVFADFTLDTATEFLFGESVECLSYPQKSIGGTTSREFSEAFRKCQDTLMRRAQLGKLYWLIDNPWFRKNTSICHTFTDYFVNKALQESPEEKSRNTQDDNYIFLSALSQETQDPKVLRDQSLNVLLAGRDTTAILLTFLFYLLTRNKDVFYKLRECVIDEFGTTTETLSFESLKRCEYLKWCLNETLRLFPPVPFLFRQAVKETSLPRGGGRDESEPIYIKKGGIVYYSAYSIHRNQSFWGKDANEFRPDRWSMIDHAATAWKYIPFGGGPRVCIGQQFALTEASYVIVRLMQSFKDIYTTEEHLRESPQLDTALTLQLKNGAYCAMVP
ncbi:hypothetical protein TRVA0_047S00452 [Trichomonascus vanleenenianus]|uniref:cytochrome P450 n=1 Tax=Trichomonascus vanleenenianus TaxID=2268995 RepID=UPI003EC9A8E1